MWTHARVFSQTLTHGNSKNEIRQRNIRRRLKTGVSMERSIRAGKNKEVPTAYHYLMKIQ